MEDEFRKLRREYGRGRLSEQDAPADPVTLFRSWFDDAVAAGIELADALALATADPTGQPSVRMVLLKGFDQRGFIFFSNYESRKGGELAGNPRAAMCVWWQPLERQVRIEGTVSRLPVDESDAYFATRPREANLGALASPQSRELRDRTDLEERLAATRAAWEGRELIRPPHWGGYRLIAATVEFWQGRADRLHDRLLYRREGDGWALARLAP